MSQLKFPKVFFELTGVDAPRFLNGLLSCDVVWLRNHAPATSRSFLLTPKGKIIAEIQVFIPDQNCMILGVDARDEQVVLLELERSIVADQVELKKSELFEEVALELFEEEVLDKPLNVYRNLNRNKYSLERTYQVCEQDGAIYLPREAVGAQHVEVWKRKNTESSWWQTRLNQESLSDGEWQKLKFHYQVARWHEEMKPDDAPIEFPLADAFSFDKGCYRGQEAVNMGTYRGKPARLMSQLRFEENLNVASAHAEVFLNEEKVGELRGVYQNNAFALLKRATAEGVGLALTLSTGEKVTEFFPLVNAKTYRGER